MRYLILGLASSGLAIARHLLDQKHTIFGMDDIDLVWNESKVVDLIKKGLKKTKTIPQVDLAILSSGIHPKSPLLQKINQKKIPTVSEAEFSFGQIQTKCIAITGTNGKTTTVYLLAHILQYCGLKVKTGGNVGKPLIHHIDEKLDYLICEMSSYQLMRQKNESICLWKFTQLDSRSSRLAWGFFLLCKSKNSSARVNGSFFCRF